MSALIKANRATVAIAHLTIDAFMLPDGSYRMSLSQAANCIGKEAQGISNFLKSKALQRLLGEAQGISNFLPDSIASHISDTTYTPDSFTVEMKNKENKGLTAMRGVHLEIVGLYWQWECLRGNKQAFALTTALSLESLERRFDDTFGVVRTEQERNDITTERIKALESDLANLGEGFAIDADKDREIAYLASVLKDNGIEPYGLPNGDRANSKGAE
jgi:hypothetical protein